ncbi:MAG TPA: GGDEF domain-containing protein [Pseudonocardiaceae bacterium]
MRDSLTASYNRRYLDQRLDDLLAAESAGTGIAVVLVDLDFFKQINDMHGHPLGDQVLQQVVDVLQAGLPDGAFCARYGGEEFVLVLPDITDAEAVAVCEAVRKQVEHYPWERLARGLCVTVSLGVAHDAPVGSETRNSGVSELLLSADGLLYEAKQSGRNAVAYRSADGVALAGSAARRRAQPCGPAVGSDSR